MMIDAKLPEGYVVLCGGRERGHTFLVRQLGPSVECDQCGQTALSVDLVTDFFVRSSALPAE